MAIQTYEFLDKSSVKLLASQLIAKSIVRIDERIVDSISENSSDKQVLSAKALYDLIALLQTADNTVAGRVDGNDDLIAANSEAISAIKNGDLTSLANGIEELANKVDGLNHLTIQTVEGSIETVTEPKTDVLYLQRDSATDPSWMIYINTESHGWVNIGDTEIDFSNYWTRSNVDEIKEALGMHNTEAITDQDIIDAVDAADAENVVTF